MDMQKIKRGQIWWQKISYQVPQKGIQEGVRPVIVVSNDANNKYSPVITVVPTTTVDKKELPTHVKLELEKPCVALCEQIKTIPIENLQNFIGVLNEEKMTEIDAGILTQLGLKSYAIEEKEPEELPIPTPVTPTLSDTPILTNTPKLKKSYAKRFGKKEKNMILTYLKAHGENLKETALFFSNYFGEEYSLMYKRIWLLNKRNKK